MQVRAGVLGVAGVAVVGDVLAGLDAVAFLEPAHERPLVGVRSVIGARRVVVEVDVVVAPAVGVGQHEGVAAAFAAVVESGDAPVRRGEDGEELLAHDVDADVAPAAGAGEVPGVGEEHVAVDGEDDLADLDAVLVDGLGRAVVGLGDAGRHEGCEEGEGEEQRGGTTSSSPVRHVVVMIRHDFVTLAFVGRDTGHLFRRPADSSA